MNWNVTSFESSCHLWFLHLQTQHTAPLNHIIAQRHLVANPKKITCTYHSYCCQYTSRCICPGYGGHLHIFLLEGLVSHSFSFLSVWSVFNYLPHNTKPRQCTHAPNGDWSSTHFCLLSHFFRNCELLGILYIENSVWYILYCGTLQLLFCLWLPIRFHNLLSTGILNCPNFI